MDPSSARVARGNGDARAEGIPASIDALRDSMIDFVRERPLQALAVALVAGFLLGRIVRW